MKWEHLFIWGTKITVTGLDDILTGSQEKHRLTQNKKLQMAKGMKKKSSESLRTR